MRNYKVLIYLFLIALVQSCQKQENGIEPEEQQLDSSIPIVDKVSVSEDKQASFLVNQYLSSTTKMRLSETTSNAFDSAVYYLDVVTGLKNYAFLLSGDDIEQISNLIFIQSDSAYIGYEVIYEPTSGHINNMYSESFLGNFSGDISYKSITTGEVFYSMTFENGETISGNNAGRLLGSNYECYPDEAGKIDCHIDMYTTYPNRVKVYATINPRTHRKEWVYKDGEPVVNYNITCEVDRDFSTCYLSFYNTNGYTTYPQFYSGFINGSLVNPTTPVFEPIGLWDIISKNVLSDLTKNSLLSLLQSDRLKEAFKEVYSKCTNRAFIDELKSNNFEFNFKIDSNLSTPGGYSQNSKTISFRSTNDINYNSVLEELFHAYQDLTVGIGQQAIAPFTGRSNIEFEAKIYADIVASIEDVPCCLAFYPNGNIGYLNWIFDITNNGTSYPQNYSSFSGRYFEFLEEFIQVRQEYNYPIDYNLTPSAMFIPFNNCN